MSVRDPLETTGKYRTLKELGRGGMGEVFLAEHVSLSTKVVVKLLHAELALKANQVDRMRLEAQALARLNHPNVVRITDFDKTPEGRPFFVMEYLPGRSLREEVLARGGHLPVAEAVDLARQTLAGLGAAHEVGLVHRDVKLDNLFITTPSGPGARPVVKVLDFGVAKVVAGAGDGLAPLSVPTSTGMVVGTPRFFAPEQARGKALDQRTDVYAAGLVLYTLLAGRGPFDDAKSVTEMAKAHVFRKPEPPSAYAPQTIPPSLDAAVLRAIAKLPEERYPTAAAFSAELASVEQQLAVGPPPAAPPASGPSAGVGGTVAIDDPSVHEDAQAAVARAIAARASQVPAAPHARTEAIDLSAYAQPATERLTPPPVLAPPPAAAHPVASWPEQAPVGPAERHVMEASPLDSSGAPARRGMSAQLVLLILLIATLGGAVAAFAVLRTM